MKSSRMRVKTNNANNATKLLVAMTGKASPAKAADRIRRVMDRLGWENRAAHTCRHPYATHQLRAGVDPKIVAIRMVTFRPRS